MALIRYDGVDHYNSLTDMGSRFDALQWYNLSSAGQAPFSSIGDGRSGRGKYFNLCSALAGLSSGVQQMTAGFGVNLSGGDQIQTVRFLDQVSGQTQILWTLNPNNGIISAANGSGAVLASALNSISGNGWFFIELQAKIAPTAGTLALRVNGAALTSFPDLTNIDTFNSNSSGQIVSGVLFQSGNGEAYTTPYDDFYFADGTTGPGAYPNNSFLGDVRNASLFPISNSAVSWTPLTGANWQEVCETAMDGDTSYNSTATAGAQDTFNFGPLDVDVNQVVALQITVAIRKEDAGSRTVAPVIVLSDTAYVGTPVSVDVSYLYITSIWPINPNTGASWTTAQINALVAGYVVVT